MALIGRVVKRIRYEYKMYATDYLKLLSNTDEVISMVYDFLFYFVGDLIEAEVNDPNIFSSPMSAAQMRARLPEDSGSVGSESD